MNRNNVAPSGIRFQTPMSASFTNRDKCYTSNLWLSLSLITLLTASCIFFALTESIVYKGKVWTADSRQQFLSAMLSYIWKRQFLWMSPGFTQQVGLLPPPSQIGLGHYRMTLLSYYELISCTKKFKLTGKYGKFTYNSTLPLTYWLFTSQTWIWSGTAEKHEHKISVILC